MAPYKKPERDIPENAEFNNHVSMLRIHSEHAIGFLKGRFPSLKNLRLQIKNAKEHRIATLWVTACIGLHNFALRHEAEEKAEEGAAYSPAEDPFVLEGLSDSDSDGPGTAAVPIPSSNTRRLRLAKQVREKLKQRLFRAKDKRRQHRTERRRQALHQMYLLD